MNIKKSRHMKSTSFLLIAFGLVILVIGIPLVINEFYKFGPYKTQWNAEHVLGYYGTILSGVATFGAVYLTIRHERKIRKKEYEERLAYEFRPFFIIESIELGWFGLGKDTFQNYSTNLYDTKVDENNVLSFRHSDDKWKIFIPQGFLPEDELIMLYILIKNIGSGAAINIIPVDDEIKYVKHIDQVVEASCSNYIDFSIGNYPKVNQ